MGVSTFDIVKANQYLGLPAGGSDEADQVNTGAVFYVNNSTTGLLTGAIGGSNGNSGTSPLEPFSTVDFAVGQCVANRGDTIYVMPGHAETYATAGALAIDVAGIEIIGIGVGNTRPVFTFSDTASTITQSANNTKLKNVIITPSVDSVVNAVVVTGNNCEVDIESQDASAAIEFVTSIRLDTADGAKVNLVHKGFTAGNAGIRCIAVDDSDNVRINIDAHGIVSTAWVNMVDAASTNALITGYAFTQGITNGSRLGVDTVGGSTWFLSVYDGSAGALMSGGSASAVASDDVSTIASIIGTADLTTTDNLNGKIGTDTEMADSSLFDMLAGGTGIVTWPAAAAPGNGVSLSEGLRHVVETQLGTIVNTGGTATVGGILGDLANDSLVARLNDIGSDVNAITTETIQGKLGTDTEFADRSLFDLLLGDGPASYPAAAAPANDVSLAEVQREIFDQADKAVTNTTATLVNGTTIFTIAGGPIEILSLVARCVTINDGTASTLQWSCDPTDGAATTFSAASASIANVAAGGTVVLQGTTLATAPVVNASGAGIAQQVTNGITIPAGIITIVIGVGSTTGTWQHHLRFRPLARGVTVS